ncbi:hypothetical protein IAU59_007106 [Kwoniella sp. CBS 9459]
MQPSTGDDLSVPPADVAATMSPAQLEAYSACSEACECWAGLTQSSRVQLAESRASALALAFEYSKAIEENKPAVTIEQCAEAMDEGFITWFFLYQSLASEVAGDIRVPLSNPGEASSTTQPATEMLAGEAATQPLGVPGVVATIQDQVNHK